MTPRAKKLKVVSNRKVVVVTPNHRKAHKNKLKNKLKFQNNIMPTDRDSGPIE